MLDFFFILTKGGLVLWCMPSSAIEFIQTVNDVIDKVVLQGQGNVQKWVAPFSPQHIHYKLDNEFELVFILSYQKVLKISYADKFLDEIQKRFRDLYKDDLTSGGFNRSFPFRVTYEEVLWEVEYAEDEAKKVKRLPRSYEESDKKLKTVKIVTKKSDVTKDEKKNAKPKKKAASKKPSATAIQNEEVLEEEDEEENNDQQKETEETKEEPLIVHEEKERIPLEDIQQSTLSVAEILKAKGKKSKSCSMAETGKPSPKSVIVSEQRTLLHQKPVK